MPLEILLVTYPRIVVKDTSVNAICYGAQLMLPGVLRYESNIEVGTECVLITTKGEAISLAVAQMSSSTMATCDHGIVARTKRVIMDRDTYDKKWKLGPYSKKKDELKQAGQLDKFGRVVDSTPEAWKMLFGDPDKAVNIHDVVAKVKPDAKTKKPAESDSEEEEAEKKRTKKKEEKEAKKEEKEAKKEKKDKKDKKKKKKAKDSDDEESD